MKSVPLQRYRPSLPFLYLAAHLFQGVQGLFLLNPKQDLTRIKPTKDRLHYQTWLWVVMKHAVCQFILATFLISAVQAPTTHVQYLLERIVTIHLDQTDLSNLLKSATHV